MSQKPAAVASKINQSIKKVTERDAGVSTSDPTAYAGGVSLKSPVTSGIKKVSL
jgi:hypothetical protein